MCIRIPSGLDPSGILWTAASQADGGRLPGTVTTKGNRRSTEQE
ncbi:MAG: hypothetical protein R3298_07730 [Gammaproteobacteria bacterium]|nr:hypothetical protein [Gammaproteobacteria bacterium]